MTKRKRRGAYTVLDDTSTRLSNDPRSPGYHEWLHWSKGDVATEWPEHADVAGWVQSGHWQPVDAPAEEEN